MVQCFSYCDPLRGIESQKPLHEVQELLIDAVYWRNDFLQRACVTDVSLALSGSFWFWPVKSAVFEELRL